FHVTGVQTCALPIWRGNGVEDEFCEIAAGNRHGSAVAPSAPWRTAAPEHDTVPDRRTLVGIKLGTDRRMNAVGADQQVSGEVPEIGRASWRGRSARC